MNLAQGENGKVSFSSLTSNITNLLKEEDNILVKGKRHEQCHDQNENIYRSLPSTRSRFNQVQPAIGKPAVTNPRKMSEVFKTYWEGKFALKPLKQRHILAIIDRYKQFISKEAAEITLQDVIDAISATNNSSPGPDGISFKAIRANIDWFAPIILDIIHDIGAGNNPPQGFNDCRFNLLPKKKGSILVSDSRPISVTNAVNRIIASVVKTILTPVIEPILSLNQHGFFTGRRVFDNVYSFNAKFTAAREKKITAFLLFMDFEKAFDSINHDYLLKLLASIGVSTFMCNIVNGLLSNVTAHVITRQGAFHFFRMWTGVKQGCPLSPLLFILAIDPLLRNIEALPGVFVRAFADDCGAYFEDLNSLDGIKDCCDIFHLGAGLKLNIEKTECMCSTGFSLVERDYISNSSWKLLKLVYKAVYLGVQMGTRDQGKPIDTAYVHDHIVGKVKSRAKLFWNHRKKLGIGKRITMANTFLISLASYLAYFYIMPESARFEINDICRTFIAPINEVPTEVLIGHPDLPHFSPSLRNCELVNLISLYKSNDKVPTGELLGNQKHIIGPLPGPRRRRRGKRAKKNMKLCDWLLEDMDIQFHKDVAAQYVIDYKLEIEQDHSFKAIYSQLWGSEYEFHNVLPVWSKKLCKFQLTEYLDTISDNFNSLPAKANNLRNHMLLTLCNGLRTKRRLRKLDIVDDTRALMATGPTCFLCGLAEDSVYHLYGVPYNDQKNCPHCSTKKKCVFLHLEKGNCPDCILTTTCTAVRQAWSQVNNTLGWHWYNTCLANDELDSETTLQIANFHWAVWLTRNESVSNPPKHPAQAILDKFNDILRWGEKISKKDRSEQAAKEVISILANLEPNTLVCYTDGSARPNPGFCGAGIHITYNGKLVHQEGIGLGHGTNNLGKRTPWVKPFIGSSTI